jgi:hypothetical protein
MYQAWEDGKYVQRLVGNPEGKRELKRRRNRRTMIRESLVV